MTRILVPPGIGDGYWVFVKLRGFLASRGITMPDVYVHDQSPSFRSAGFWARVPFVRFAGAGKLARKSRHAKMAYSPPGIAVQRNVPGWDYFISFNGTLERGLTLDQAMPGPLNWYEPLTRPESHTATVEEYQARFGRYIACAFWDHGFYRHWLNEFNEPQIVETLRILLGEGYTPVLMGAGFDRGGLCNRLAAQDPGFVDMVGETDFDQMTALLEGAAGVFGFPAGNSLLGPYLKRPTALLWHGHFSRRMWVNVAPPDAHYRALPTRGASPSGVAEALFDLMEVAV